jgi:hypothetical protein
MCTTLNNYRLDILQVQLEQNILRHKAVKIFQGYVFILAVNICFYFVKYQCFNRLVKHIKVYLTPVGGLSPPVLAICLLHIGYIQLRVIGQYGVLTNQYGIFFGAPLMYQFTCFGAGYPMLPAICGAKKPSAVCAHFRIMYGRCFCTRVKKRRFSHWHSFPTRQQLPLYRQLVVFQSPCHPPANGSRQPTTT